MEDLPRAFAHDVRCNWRGHKLENESRILKLSGRLILQSPFYVSHIMSYCVIVGDNGISSGGASDLHAKALVYNQASNNITVVAVGPNDRYAVVTSGGAYSGRGPQGFLDKMTEISCEDIKQIAFGRNDAWAIVMKSGHCHGSCCTEPEGPLTAINEHQGNIKYVGMTSNQSEWLVGFGNNGFKSRGLDDGMVSYMRGVAAAGAIAECSLGRAPTNWIVVATNGTSRWNFDKGSSFHEKAKEAKLRVFW